MSSLVGGHANASGESNPTGIAKAHHSYEEIHTAGTYCAFTNSSYRSITDLVVPGGVGGYPLVFSRTTTSRFVAGDDGDGGPFGVGANWRHSYRWGLVLSNPGGNPSVYGMHYPDGTVIMFTSMPAPAAPTSGSPAPPADPYLRCNSAGIEDRLQVSGANMILHRQDGGTVFFTSTGPHTWQCTSITDPYGQATTLTYYTSGTYSGKLAQITEPAGRWLKLAYETLSNGAVVISTLTASNGQSVSYYYTILFCLRRNDLKD
jgi:hypothetical protein